MGDSDSDVRGGLGEKETRFADAVRYRREGIAAHITLDTPANRNALSTPLVTGLREAFAAAAADPDARVVLLGHTGGTFCAGADLSEASASASDPGEAVAERTRVFLDLLRVILTSDEPVIAVVDGHARAGGVGLVASCDFAVATQRATFGVTEVRLGLAPAMISLPLRHRMTPRALLRHMLTGEKFGPAEAFESGLLSHAPEGESSERAESEPSDAIGGLTADLVGSLRKSSPAGVAATKKLAVAPLLADLDAEGAHVAQVSAEMFLGNDAAEGMTAFLERREPSWAVR